MKMLKIINSTVIIIQFVFLLHLRLEGVGVGEGDSGRVGGDRAGGEWRKGVGGGARGGEGGARHGGPLHLIMIGKGKRKRGWMQCSNSGSNKLGLRSDQTNAFCRRFLLFLFSYFSRGDSGHVFVFLYFEADIKHRPYKSEEGPTISKLRRKRAGT